jgi:hypothetical protein|uniref:Secreted protein n=1 Tax=Zea mays TaxID=4577 RepID=A0A804P3Y3_MAIZE
MHGAGVTVCVLCMCVHGAPLLLLRVVEREREKKTHIKKSALIPHVYFALRSVVLSLFMHVMAGREGQTWRHVCQRCANGGAFFSLLDPDLTTKFDVSHSSVPTGTSGLFGNKVT